MRGCSGFSSTATGICNRALIVFCIPNGHRLKELEAAAEQLQAALLAELNAPAQGAAASTKKKGKAKKGKKKQVGIVSQRSNNCTPL